MDANTEVKPKNKIVAFLLAIVFGIIGFHNFYLGRWKKGFLQFFLVIFTFGAASFITLPWAWIEGLLILIGKYRLHPLPVYDDVQTLENAIEKVVNSKKEMLITGLSLTSMLILVPITYGMILVIAVLFYFLVGGLWNLFTRFFIRTILPLYATVFSSGKKFLIRFSEYSLPSTSSRAEVYKATRKLSMTAIFVLLFAISLIAQSNVPLVAEGEGRNAVICEDGTIEFDAFYCDEYDETVDQVFVLCDADCILESTTVLDRIMEAYLDVRVLAVLMMAPLITVLVGPVIVLKYSSLSIVDKKTRSMSPIGQKANDLTNVTAGFGSVVLFSQTAWTISTASLENGGLFAGTINTFVIFLLTILMLLVFYPLIWLPMLKFTKALESHVMMLDNQLVEKKGIEIHELTYEHNELRIKPSQGQKLGITGTREPESTLETTELEQSMSNDSAEENINTDSHVIEQEQSTDITGPDINAAAQNTDEHGFEWLQYEGENYYRQVGSISEWTKY